MGGRLNWYRRDLCIHIHIFLLQNYGLLLDIRMSQLDHIQEMHHSFDNGVPPASSGNAIGQRTAHNDDLYPANTKGHGDNLHNIHNMRMQEVLVKR